MEIVKKFLTVKEVADYLGSTPAFIWKLTFEKRIRHYKPGGKKIYFALDDIETYITSGMVVEAKPEFDPEKQFEE